VTVTSFDRLNARGRPARPTRGPAKWIEAPDYDPGPELETALNMAMALGQPLLITGEPGCGKTSAAYYAAWRMRLDPGDVIHETVRSDASAARLKYDFDHVRYFRDAQEAAARASAEAMRAALDHKPLPAPLAALDRRAYVTPGTLWKAFAPASASKGEDHGRDTVLLLDEIDKAPRDFPNDLLHELDLMEFTVSETNEVVRAADREGKLALVVITSNQERELPNAFLRRCVHHHIEMDPIRVAEIVKRRVGGELDDELVDLALDRYDKLRSDPALDHRPALSELLVWLRVIALSGRKDIVDAIAAAPLAELPYLGALVKTPADRAKL
jgi:MoxR-like ATPase